MSKLFPRLFSPVSLRGRSLGNRIVFGAHPANTAENGVPRDQHVTPARHRRRRDDRG
ncbi:MULTISPECIES: hypothetical protein [Rhizobium]|uniref:hypothetical protein n=1 Tax=Rhizobium sp. S9 TaxID=2035454 RepID=UPI001EF08FA0|nr:MULTISPECIES: hypothetical protein [Rhizobium]